MSNVKPFDLSLVPSGLDQFVYEEERILGTIACPESVYMIVLAMRFLLVERVSLSYTYDRPDSHKVFWRINGQNAVDIIVYRERITDEDYDSEQFEWVTVQEHQWCNLATVYCWGDEIRSINSIAVGPYGKALVPTEMAIGRLIDDAALSGSCSPEYGHQNTWRSINHYATLSYSVNRGGDYYTVGVSTEYSRY